MARSDRTRAVLAGLLFVSSTLIQSSNSALRGTWTATTATQTFRGSWGAEISPRSPNEAQGYWTLLDSNGARVLQGTWFAKRIGTRWHGTWTSRTSEGRSFSGVWDADITGSKAKTFADMLMQTIEKEVAGSWQSGHYSGNWWLNGLKGKSVRR